MLCRPSRETAFIALQSKRHRYDAKLPNRSSPANAHAPRHLSAPGRRSLRPDLRLPFPSRRSGPGNRLGHRPRLPAAGSRGGAGRVPLAAPEPRPCRLRALDEEASGTAGLFLRKPARGVALDAHRTRRLGAAGSGQRRGLQLRPGLFGRRHPVGLRPWPTAGQCTSATTALGGQAALFGEARRTFPFAPAVADPPVARPGRRADPDRPRNQRRSGPHRGPATGPAPLRQPRRPRRHAARAGTPATPAGAGARFAAAPAQPPPRNGYRMPTCGSYATPPRSSPW